MPEQYLFDPTSEGTGTQLDVSTDPYGVSAFSSPAPPLETATSGSIDTEGDAINARRHQNRQVSLTVEVTGTSQTNLDANVATLEAKVAKFAREGGTLRKVRADGTFRTFDILAADSYEKTFDLTYLLGNMAVCQINLIAEPYARGAEVTFSSHSELTLPALVFTETGVTGDVSGGVRLVVTEAAAQNQGVALWGIQSKYYDPAATAALFYQSEACALGAGTVAVGPAGASGTSVVQHLSLTTTGVTLHYLGTTTAAQTHIGTFRVIARVYAPAANAGTVTMWASWQVGSGPVTSNNRVTVPYEDEWLLVDLGLVRIPKAKYGNQRWGGFINAASTVAGDDINSDCIALIPVDEGSGVAYSTALPTIPSGGTIQFADSSVLKASASVYSTPDVYEGDLPKMPVSGSTVRVIAMIGRGPVTFPLRAAPPVYGQNTIDDLSAQVFVTPRFLNLT